jgi:pseudouridine-5'-phosphate glycosidase
MLLELKLHLSLEAHPVVVADEGVFRPLVSDLAAEAARLLMAHWGLGGAGVVLAQPVAEDVALDPEEFDAALTEAERLAAAAGVRGPTVTPF